MCVNILPCNELKFLILKPMEKFKILFLLLVFFALRVSAGVDNISLVVELRDGSHANFLLADKPKITFTVEQMSIVSENLSMEFERSNVKKYHFASDASTGICDTPAESTAVVENNTLIISGVADGTAITICNVNGAIVKQTTAVAGSCTLTLSDLANGFYLVRNNNTAFKFLKK